MEVHLPIDGGASGMGILPMLPGARPRARCPCQCDSARQTLPSIGRCGRRMARMKNGRRGPECQDREPTGAGRCAERRGQTAGAVVAGRAGLRLPPPEFRGRSRIAPLSGLGSRFAGPGNALPSFRRRNALPGAASLGHKQVMIVGVHPLAGFDKLLHYRVPETLRGAVGVGSLVRVPVLRSHRLGIVGEIGEPVGFPLDRLKSISQVVHPFPALPPDLLQLARWISAYYAAGLDTVIEAMLPGAVRGGATLKQERLLAVERVIAGGELAALAKRAPQQARLYDFLRQQFKPVAKPLVLSRLGLTAAVSNALIKRGLVREETRRLDREGYGDDWAHGEAVAMIPPTLNEEQAVVVAAVRASLDRRAFAVHLLHGVTGSGKTEVYLHAVSAVLEAGGGVVYLVPEVALTPQTVARLHGRLQAIAPNHKVVVWHSHLSEGERFDGWRALATGEARVVVGARSAVFAPVHDLRLIVVDEEHEPAYKQDETPRYHGRDVAVVRAKLCQAVCLRDRPRPRWSRSRTPGRANTTWRRSPGAWTTARCRRSMSSTA